MPREQTYRALLVEETAPGHFQRRIAARTLKDLPPGDVLIRVKYSSLNYKDALSASGNKGVTKTYPHIPGIDAAGIVEESKMAQFKPGDEVIVASVDMGATSAGGYGQYVRVPADWVIPLPPGLTLRESMTYGTAGFTAALSVDRLMRGGVTPEKGDILVTGATGGVGSIAIGILAKERYRVVAATGKPQDTEMLRQMGAVEVIHRDEINDNSGRPLLSGRWAGVVDAIGGNYLASAIRATKPEGVVTACGNAASPDLNLTVYPFILRGVSLIGIDALHISHAERERLWQKLGNEWKLDRLDENIREVTLEDLDREIEKTLAGQQTGRVIVNLE